MLTFYFISFVIFCVGLAFFIKRQEVAMIEWVGASVAAFFVSGMFHAIAFHGMTADKEIWSGKIILAKQFSAWREYYEEAIYRTETYQSGTDDKGNPVYSTRQVFDHWESRRRWHDEYFVLYSNIDTQYNVSKDHYIKVVNEFGGKRQSVPGDRTTMNHASRMIDGDPYDYETRPDNGCIYPVLVEKSFTNRIKAAPTVFSYGKVSEQEKKELFEYPYVYSNFESGRVMGSAKNVISTRKWDEMNAVLGPLKQANVIIIGYLNKDISVAMNQESLFIGGKKNDIVICYGGATANKADWAHVFSWSEKEDFKSNLESIILGNNIDNSIIENIKKEITMNYVRKDWKKFDYISISARPVHYVWFFITIIFTQLGIWIYIMLNDYDKSCDGNSMRSFKKGLAFGRSRW